MERLAEEVERRIAEQRNGQGSESDASDSHGRKERLRQEQDRIRSALQREQVALRAHTRASSGEPLDGNESLSWLGRLRRGIAKTREGLAAGLTRLATGSDAEGPQLLASLEDALLAADVGPKTTARLIAAMKDRMRNGSTADGAQLRAAVREEIVRLMDRPIRPARVEALPAAERPAVVLFVGINGSGKTTTIGKLASRYRSLGLNVLLAAGDTFRAAAAEQLTQWATRTGCEIFAKEPGSDPAAVLYQALQLATSRNFDVLLCDTAGRLHTKSNLMEELKKVKRVLAKVKPDAPQETWLVIDGNNGHNAIRQVHEFHDALGLTGLIVTKLDGTARGGMVIGIANEFDLPIRYIGIGESAEDLQPFDPVQFAHSLFDGQPGA
jgi:fused signal recognition particle receptor